MMKVAMFTTKESYVAWLTGEIEAITKNGLRQAREAYEAALKGEGKEAWLKMNNITEEGIKEEVWNHHLDWLKGNVKYMEKKIKKYQREIAKTL